MIVAVVVLAVAVAALLVAVVLLRSRATARAAERDAALAEASEARAAATEADASRQRADGRAAEAALATAAAEERARAAEGQAEEAAATAATAEQAAVEAEAALVALRRSEAGGGEGLWVLEALRIERRWRQISAAGADRSPFPGRGDPARVAVEVVLAASREEAGTGVELRWDLAEALAPPQALALVRVVEELVAGLAHATDGGTLEVGDGPQVRLRLEPPTDLPPELATALLVLGATVDHVDGAVVIALGR